MRRRSWSVTSPRRRPLPSWMSSWMSSAEESTYLVQEWRQEVVLWVNPPAGWWHEQLNLATTTRSREKDEPLPNAVDERT